jgi:hypothetical protein
MHMTMPRRVLILTFHDGIMPSNFPSLFVHDAGQPLCDKLLLFWLFRLDQAVDEAVDKGDTTVG